MVSHFENDRQYVFRKLDEYDKKINEAERIQKEIEDKAKKESSKKSTGSSTEPESNDKGKEDKNDLTVKASEAKKVIDQKDSIIKDLEDENKLLRANGYVPPEYWLLSDDDIYKSSIFLPVQDELMSILFTGKTAPQTAKSNLGYENVIRNTNQITQRTGGLNPEAFK